jgi:hypothetical protein
MSHHCRSCLAACLMGVGCLLFVGIDVSAGDKKKDEKQKEKPKKPAPLLEKAEELKTSDEKDTKPGLTKSPRKVYSITFAEGKKYQIDLKSKDFDPFLRLLDAQGAEVAFNDDFDPFASLDSRIVYQPAKSGEYKIIVTSYNAKVGKFTLAVIEADAKTPLMTGSRFAGKAVELQLKDGKARHLGELTEKDAANFRRYYKLFTVPMDKDKTYRIECRADDPKALDAHVLLEDADGTLLDSAAGSIVHKAAKTGTFRVIATTARELQTGKFTLEIVPAEEAKKSKK